MLKWIDHVYILSTVLFTVYSQIIFRWQVGLAGPLPADAYGKIRFIIAQLANPWVISAIGATFLAGVSWMLAMTKFEVSYAYPFVSLTYVLILAASVVFFHEAMSFPKVAGSILIVLGIITIARG